MKKQTKNVRPYFAIFDEQTGCYMHTGYNERTLKNVAEAYISYKSIDTNAKELRKRINLFGIEVVLKEDEFILEKQENAFDDTN